MNLGLIGVGLPYSYTGQTVTDEVAGGSPYGATTIRSGDGSRQPSPNELDGARFQGRYVAAFTRRLFG
jgi:NAD(P)H dehydrogenase (quinone)